MMIGRWAGSTRLLGISGLLSVVGVAAGSVAVDGASAAAVHGTTAVNGTTTVNGTAAMNGAAAGVVAWGANDSGQLGDGYAMGRGSAGFVNGLTAGVVQVAAGNGLSVALRADGSVVAWGRNDAGQLGNATVGAAGSGVPVVVDGVSGVTQISAGGAFVLARRSDGQVYVWGDNQFGEGGDPAHTEAVRPPALVPGLSDIVEVSAGGDFAMARDSHGTVWTWGRNLANSLGDPNRTDDNYVRYTPAPVPGIPDAVGIEAGFATAFAIRSDRTLWAWGDSTSFTTGIPGVLRVPGARQVPGLSDVVQVACAYLSTLVLRGDGTVWGMGYNYEGEILAGGADVHHQHNNIAPPVQVPGLPAVTQVADTDFTSIALAANGTVWVWGTGAEGLYGDGRGDAGIEAGMHVVTGLNQVTSIAGSAHRDLNNANLFHSHILAITSEPAVVPDLTYSDPVSAARFLRLAGLTVGPDTPPTGQCFFGDGWVIGQDVTPGTVLPPGTPVNYYFNCVVP